MVHAVMFGSLVSFFGPPNGHFLGVHAYLISKRNVGYLIKHLDKQKPYNYLAYVLVTRPRCWASKLLEFKSKLLINHTEEEEGEF